MYNLSYLPDTFSCTVVVVLHNQFYWQSMFIRLYPREGTVDVGSPGVYFV